MPFIYSNTISWICIYLALNYHNNQIGKKIGVSLIGPLTKSTNTSHDYVTMDVLIGEEHVTQYFDIERSTSDQNKLEKVEFYVNIDSNVTNSNLSMQFNTNALDGVSFQLYIDPHSMDKQIGALCGAIILISLNVLIITEVRSHLYFFVENLIIFPWTGRSSNTCCIIGRLCIGWNTGSAKGSTNHGWHDQMDWLRNIIVDIFYDGYGRHSHRHWYIWLHRSLYIPSK